MKTYNVRYVNVMPKAERNNVTTAKAERETCAQTRLWLRFGVTPIRGEQYGRIKWQECEWNTLINPKPAARTRKDPLVSNPCENVRVYCYFRHISYAFRVFSAFRKLLLF